MVGSPPHTRERLTIVTDYLCEHGITPAYAGKTGGKIMTPAEFQDHPRIRGKDVNNHNIEHLLIGSPPHTRERLRDCISTKTKSGITPAYAGKTDSEITAVIYA